MLGSVVMNTVSGTGCGWSGSGARIINSSWINNGAHFDRTWPSGFRGWWSDGLTLNECQEATVEGNVFADNSDINIIVAGASGGLFRRNSVRMVNNGAFGGMMADNFNTSGPPSDYAGAAFRENLVDCGGRCHFGIELGGHPWYMSANLVGPATITNNTVGGAAVLINAYGAGTADGPFSVFNNTFSGPCVDGVQFLCGGYVSLCSAINIAPDSVIDRAGETIPVASTEMKIFRGCP
jgi:hypothetical protein